MGGSAVALEAQNPGLIQVSKDSGEPLSAQGPGQTGLLPAMELGLME